MKDVSHSMYFRLRGTNLAPGTPGQTDTDGNPILDTTGMDQLHITPAGRRRCCGAAA